MGRAGQSRTLVASAGMDRFCSRLHGPRAPRRPDGSPVAVTIPAGESSFGQAAPFHHRRSPVCSRPFSARFCSSRRLPRRAFSSRSFPGPPVGKNTAESGCCARDPTAGSRLAATSANDGPPRPERRSKRRDAFRTSRAVARSGSHQPTKKRRASEDVPPLVIDREMRTPSGVRFSAGR